MQVSPACMPLLFTSSCTIEPSFVEMPEAGSPACYMAYLLEVLGENKPVTCVT